ncbi:hypothetical protein [Rahnella sikkimica]|uniref:Uncharacterized protein n=1 Tax=Rahnella sikkimica TaxID=1805933 RepID=A0A2L1UMI9_9GAMM|nr:hypothetical protein [Rahnella sikkimica]AVF34157.1 hypothetical protein BV494_04025 [Rahnella sikkimica]
MSTPLFRGDGVVMAKNSSPEVSLYLSLVLAVAFPHCLHELKIAIVAQSVIDIEQTVSITSFDAAFLATL